MDTTKYPENLKISVPRERLLIVPVVAFKRTEEDSWEQGVIADCGCESIDTPSSGASIVDVMAELVGSEITFADIVTMDPNHYIDSKSGITRVCKDNTAAGLYRVEYDRLEDDDGKEVTANSNSWCYFVSGQRNYWHVIYELHFKLVLVGFDEFQLAEFLGVKNHG